MIQSITTKLKARALLEKSVVVVIISCGKSFKKDTTMAPNVQET
jgi:hypothetical protein